MSPLGGGPPPFEERDKPRFRMRYQFQLDGRPLRYPVRDDWVEAAQDAVSAGHAVWIEYPNSIKIDQTLGGEIARIQG